MKSPQRFRVRGGYWLRLMAPADLEPVLGIERASFPRPWSREAFLGEIKAEHARAYVLTQEGMETVCGYLCWWVVAEEAHLLNICLAPNHRRRGLARIMLNFLISLARSQGLGRIYLEVRPSNHPALGLYDSAGFKEVGRRKGYYDDSGEDAILMTLELGPDEPPGPTVKPPAGTGSPGSRT